MLVTPRLLAQASCLFAVGTSALAPRVVHESRRYLPSGWTPVRRAEPSIVLPLRIGLVQQNLADIETYLLDVSHPDSPNYGEQWSPAKVASMFRPSSESVDAVHGWLVESGVDAPRVRLSAGSGWIQVNVTIEEAEHLLSTEYYVYEYGSGEGVEHIACEGMYHLPEDVSKHVDFITPTLHFDAKPKRNPELKKRISARQVNANVSIANISSIYPKTTGTAKSVFNNVNYCDEQIIPDCLRALYNFIYEPTVADNNSIGIVEYTPNVYVPSDLDEFFDEFSVSQVGERPILYSIDGGYLQTVYTGFYFNGESNLDLQYAMGLLGPEQSVNLYQTGDMVEGASFNNFLDALDGSYCTFEGGGNLDYDAEYPDPYGGYQGPEACGTIPKSYVITTSYGYSEAQLTPAYVERQCAEYAKLGLMGITVLYSSGDDGVGNAGLCLTDDGELSYNPYATRFNPSFPGGCPYITSVGATQIVPGNTVYQPEEACETVIYSGGGFSNVFPLPKYQEKAVKNYLNKYPPGYPADTYNCTSRAFPDLSANGANYLVVVQGEYYMVYGTSASSPVTAAILTAINDARFAVGKKSIGFINPAIYTEPFMQAFNDIVAGSNPGCGTEGFYAQPGWDPVTGVGTPNFVKLLELWLLLP
ncbi:subtilisin-like protein [Sparassis latifolia]|uniref:tripeptidyl-peptidase II n=1 Tax=Sparassis crispa TaxID=139825 RepID=A0A401GRR6_9APHY|nr:Aorsin [Sparassis crispa]GBE84917.1 Aorsin [Sparassis crispa]